MIHGDQHTFRTQRRGIHRALPPEIVARTIASVWGIWWMLFSIMAGIGEGLGLVGIVLHPGWLFLLVALIAWRWQTLGGALLLIVGLGTLMAFPFAWSVEGFIILALPPIVAGVLFLMPTLSAKFSRIR